jgi:hypothetical protein
MTKLAKIDAATVKRAVERGELGNVLVAVAEVIEQADDVEALWQLGAMLEASADVVETLRGHVEEAERAERALRRVHLQSRHRLGRLLAKLEPGAKGKAKGERARVAEAAGIPRDTTRRLVEFGELDEGAVVEAIDKLDEGGQPIAMKAVVKACTATSSGADYKGDEWYTPPDVLERARRVLGGVIDCDLASCAVAQRNVKARCWWSAEAPEFGSNEQAAGMTEDDFAEVMIGWRGLGDIKDGFLTQPAAGTVWCNPPYSIPGPFARAILDGRRSGMVTAAILLVNVATDTASQQELLRRADAVCWVRGRMAFLDQRGKQVAGNRYAQVIFYFGDKVGAFWREFGEIGVVHVDNFAPEKPGAGSAMLRIEETREAEAQVFTLEAVGECCPGCGGRWAPAWIEDPHGNAWLNGAWYMQCQSQHQACGRVGPRVEEPHARAKRLYRPRAVEVEVEATEQGSDMLEAGVDVRVLSVHQPWAALLVRGIKDVENRPQKHKHRGPVLIAAGKQWDRQEVETTISRLRACKMIDVELDLDALELECGHVIGAVEMVDCKPVEESQSVWATDGFAWEVKGARQCKPVPWRGQQGLVRAPAELLREVRFG